MKKSDAFSGCHPLVGFLYFALVIGFSSWLMHPACLFASLFSAVCYYIKLSGRASLGFFRSFALPVLFVTAVVNPAFNHQGSIILCYLPTGNPLTLESILYGVGAGIMLMSVLLWFGCYTKVMTSDKFVYLFGRIIPAMSLILSMTLRFVPLFKAQLENVRMAQAGLGRDMSHGSLISRMRSAVRCFSVMVTWSLENAIETADSMKARGWGLKGRTAFSIYTFTERDKYLICWLIFAGVYVLCGASADFMFWRYFPSIRAAVLSIRSISFYTVYFAVCMTPIIIDGREERQWKKSFYASKI